MRERMSLGALTLGLALLPSLAHGSNLRKAHVLLDDQQVNSANRIVKERVTDITKDPAKIDEQYRLGNQFDKMVFNAFGDISKDPRFNAALTQAMDELRSKQSNCPELSASGKPRLSLKMIVSHGGPYGGSRVYDFELSGYRFARRTKIENSVDLPLEEQGLFYMGDPDDQSDIRDFSEFRASKETVENAIVSYVKGLAKDNRDYCASQGLDPKVSKSHAKYLRSNPKTAPRAPTAVGGTNSDPGL